MSNDSPEVAAIEAAARDYIEGWYAGDVARMDRALHTDLVKRILVDEEFRPVTKDRMIEMTASGGGEMPDPEFEIDVYAVSDGIASARTVSPEYIDHLHLVETPDGWRIANVLFITRD
ncbi:MAG: hypothetical protein HKN80_03075 [Acidimicrobiia bacterium]|nr:hypothetical protein [Acidimicrobiia bacterium]NNC91457.1 hypothetical protein [Acidimicrobiia bacterium]